MVSSLIHYVVARKRDWWAWHCAVLPVGLAAIVSAMAFISGTAFAVEAAGEMAIIALGFGILIPVLSGQKTGTGSIRS